MNELQALLLGVVQGLTEFLPISSSGHLILVPWVLDFHYLEQHPEFNKTFDVALHSGHAGRRADVLPPRPHPVRAGSACAARGGAASRPPTSGSGWLIVIATLPAAAIGALAEQRIEDDLGQPWQIAILLAVFAILLYLADRLPERREIDGLSWRDAALVGVAQAVALAPGTSRSGITITAGRALGLTRAAAARFSFLLLAPITFGAVVYEGIDLAFTGLPAGSLGPFVVGILAAAVSGFAAIWGMLRYLQTHSYDIFVWYRLIVAAVILLLIATGRAVGHLRVARGAPAGRVNQIFPTSSPEVHRPPGLALGWLQMNASSLQAAGAPAAAAAAPAWTRASNNGGGSSPAPMRSCDRSDARARAAADREPRDPGRRVPAARGRQAGGAHGARVPDVPGPGRAARTGSSRGRRSTRSCGADRWHTAIAPSTSSCVRCAASWRRARRTGSTSTRTSASGTASHRSA